MTLIGPGGLFLLLAALFALSATHLLIALAHRRHWVAKPKADRWSQTPTALFGGVAIVLAYGVFAGLGWLPVLLQTPRYDLLGLLAGGALIFAVGLCDDAHAMNPQVKMLGQVMAITPFLVGVQLAHPTPVFALSLPLVMFWMLALTNAFNLLDNMDGLSAGTAAIVGAALSVGAYAQGETLVGGLSALMTACCLGFLWHNFRWREPARIFMGDCGSMFLGHMLAGLSVILVYSSPRPVVNLTIALPLLIMALPLFDTTLVIIRRKCEGRSISQGGRDHSSHRLVYAGWGEKRAVLLLYGMSALGGLAALGLQIARQPLAIALTVVGGAGALLWLGIYLSHFTGPQAGASGELETASASAPMVPAAAPAVVPPSVPAPPAGVNSEAKPAPAAPRSLRKSGSRSSERQPL